MIGYNEYDTTISNVYVTGTVGMETSGICTWDNDLTTLNNCYTNINSSDNFYAIGRNSGVYGSATVNNVYYVNGEKDYYTSSATQVTKDELSALVIPPTASPPDITLKIGIDTTSNSEMTFNTGFHCEISINVLGGNYNSMLSSIDNAISNLTTKQNSGRYQTG